MSVFDNYPSHQLTRTTFLMMAKGNENMKLLKITGAQMYVMMLLWENEGSKVTQKQIYNAMEIKPPSLTKLIGQLEKKGYIAKKVDPEDKRSSIISLTKAGMALRVKAMKLADYLDDKIFNGITSKEKTKLKNLLLKIQDNLSKM